jgi:MFS family permease
VATTFETSRRRLTFGVLLAWTMVAATSSMVTLPVVATFVIDEFDISRAEFGALLAALTAGGAIASPWAGRITDRVGGRNAMVAVLSSSAAAALLLAVAPVFAAMFVATAVAMGGAAANPGTNKLIAAHTAPGRRGFLTGVKQTGPQIGSLVAGLAAPFGAAALGWRPTVALIAVFCLAPIPVVFATIPADERAVETDGKVKAQLPTAVRWLTVLALLVGLGGSSALLIPLFVEEGLGQSNRVAGLAAAVQGGVAVFGRIAWARAAERIGSPWVPTAVIALLSAVSSVAMVAAIGWGAGWMWIGAATSGVAAGAWTSAGAVAVITLVGPRAAGRATGLVWMGFLGGLGIGPPVFGWAVDRTGSYAVMWWLATGVFAALLAAAWAWGRTRA